MTRRDYCLHLNQQEGPACIQVNVDDSGAISLEVTVSGEEEEEKCSCQECSCLAREEEVPPSLSGRTGGCGWKAPCPTLGR